MADIILLAILFSFEVILFYFLPVFNGKGTLFGLVLEENNYLKEGLPILNKYRRDLLLALFLTALGFIFFANRSLHSLAITYILGTTAIIFLLFRYLMKTWRLRDRRVAGRLATSLKPRNLSDFTHIWLEVCVAAITILPFVLLIHYYPQLPEVVPVHWNASGEADRWEAKSFFNVFFPAVLSLWLQVFWVILKQDIIQARLRVPAENAEIVLSLKEISLQANVGLVDWCRLIVGLLLTAISLLILSTIPSFPLSFGLNISIWALVVLLLAGLAFFIYRMILANREIKSLTGQVTFQTGEEMSGWNSAGLYYYNPNDVAFMVEKPGGVGYTVNFAHKRTIIYAVLIFLPTAFVLIGTILMSK